MDSAWESENQQVRQAQAQAADNGHTPRVSIFKWFDHKPDPGFWSPTASSKQRQMPPLSPTRFSIDSAAATAAPPATTASAIPAPSTMTAAVRPISSSGSTGIARPTTTASYAVAPRLGGHTRTTSQTQLVAPTAIPSSSSSSAATLVVRPTKSPSRAKTAISSYSAALDPPTGLPAPMPTGTPSALPTSARHRESVGRSSSHSRAASSSSALPVPMPTTSRPKTPSTLANAVPATSQVPTLRQRTPGMRTPGRQSTPGVAADTVEALQAKVGRLEIALEEEKQKRRTMEVELTEMRQRLTAIEAQLSGIDCQSRRVF